MTIREIMSENVTIVSVDDTVDEVAGKMKQEGFGRFRLRAQW